MSGRFTGSKLIVMTLPAGSGSLIETPVRVTAFAGHAFMGHTQRETGTAMVDVPHWIGRYRCLSQRPAPPHHQHDERDEVPVSTLAGGPTDPGIGISRHDLQQASQVNNGDGNKVYGLWKANLTRISLFSTVVSLRTRRYAPLPAAGIVPGLAGDAPDKNPG